MHIHVLVPCEAQPLVMVKGRLEEIYDAHLGNAERRWDLSDYQAKSYFTHDRAASGATLILAQLGGLQPTGIMLRWRLLG